jgi:hypothetical protein
MNSWLRYIRNSRSRLAHTFRRFFLPVALYNEDSDALVENRLSVAHLRTLYEQLPDDGTLTEVDRQTLVTVRRLPDGEFRNGISSPDELYAHGGAASA